MTCNTYSPVLLLLSQGNGGEAVLAPLVGLTMEPPPRKKAILQFFDPNNALCRNRLDPMLNHQKVKSRKIKAEKNRMGQVMGGLTVAVVLSAVVNTTRTALTLV